MGELVTESMLRTNLSPQQVDALIESVKAQLEDEARGAFKERDFTFRELMPSDLPGYTNEEWLETSGTDNTWAVTTGGDGTAIADDTILLIYGVSILTPAVSPIISGLRFTVGASLRAQFSVYNIWPIISSGTAAGSVVPVKVGYLAAPIIIHKQTTLTIYEAVLEATTAYRMVLHGITAEVKGKSINP